MFYSQCLVSRNGPLGAIWVAAYFFKKLKKAQVKDTHIPSSVDQILQTELDALTYRVLAYLLLGVVRIYSKKVDFLFDDCNKALNSVKEFVAKEKNRENTSVSLPASSTECFSIAMPESFQLDAFDLGILEDFHGGNVKPLEDITLKEGSQETESMDQYTMERFDMEEDQDLLSTFHETFSAGRNETKHASFARDMDIDAENIRDTTQETSVRGVEAETLDSNESSRGHQNASRHREDPESDDMHVEPQMSEDIRRAQEEDTVNETISSIVQRLANPYESSGDNLHRENSESERTSVGTSWEKMRHDRSFLSECGSPEAIHGIEEQPSGATRIDGEKEIPETSTLEEAEPGSATETRELPEGIEKRRGHSDGEMTDFEMFHESHKEPSETSEVKQVGLHNGTEADMTVSEEGSNGFHAKDTPVAVTPKAPSRLGISEGKTSPQFSIIPTPAAKESSRALRKRKCQCVIDDEVIIPSKVMKKMIEDSSSLVSKRRKDPSTDYPEKRTKRVADLSRSFLDPLIPYGALDPRLLYCQPIKRKKPNTTRTPKAAKTVGRIENTSRETVGSHGNVVSSEQTANAEEIMETPQAAALAELRVTVPETVGNNTEVSAETEASSIAAGTALETPVKPTDIAPETPARTSEQPEIAPETPVVSEKVEIAPDTPVRESMSSTRFFEDPETCYRETRPASSFTSFDEQPSLFRKENRDLDAILMNEEVNAHEGEDLRQETWSARTRNVVKFLEKKFQEKKEKEEEEMVSLLQLCRGRSQKESARLFYETLVLKTKGYLEVQQDHPYSDIFLTTRQQQVAC